MNRIQIIAIAIFAALVPATLSAQITIEDPRIEEGQALADEKKWTEAEARFADACKDKIGQGCYFQSTLIRRYRYTPDIHLEEMKLLEKGCRLKYGQACNSLAVDLTYPVKGVEKDLARAKKLTEKACEFGWGSGCETIAGYYASGKDGYEKSDKKAADYLAKGCEAKQPSGDACKDLAVMQAEGKGGPADLDAAIATLRKAYKLNPTDREIQAIGGVLMKKKQEEEAKETSP